MIYNLTISCCDRLYITYTKLCDTLTSCYWHLSSGNFWREFIWNSSWWTVKIDFMFQAYMKFVCSHWSSSSLGSFLHPLWHVMSWYRTPPQPEIGECWMNCFIKHGVYSGYTYRAVSIKVLGDHKVHSAVLLSFPGIDFTAVLIKGLLVLTTDFYALNSCYWWIGYLCISGSC